MGIKAKVEQSVLINPWNVPCIPLFQVYHGANLNVYMAVELPSVDQKIDKL